MNSDVQSAIIAAAAVLLAKPIESFFEKRKQKKEALKVLNEKSDLSDEDYYDKIGEVLGVIQKETQAHRVFYLAAQNGEKTLDNYSIKKLSIVAEVNAEGVDEIIHQMQNVPVVTFKRKINLLKLAPSGYSVSNESELIDRLSRINVSYGMNTMLSFKVMNIKHGEHWTGILCIGFEECDRHLAETEIAWCSVQAARVETIISKI